MSHPVRSWIETGVEKQLAEEQQNGTTLGEPSAPQAAGRNIDSGDTGRLPVSESLL
jgi:hypothetical protein